MFIEDEIVSIEKIKSDSKRHDITVEDNNNFFANGMLVHNCQNLVEEINAAITARSKFEVTEKLEGSSMTCYWIDGEFGVCSRNLDLKRDPNNTLWKVAIEDDIEAKLIDSTDIAIQGEIVGPGIQGNIYKLNKHEFRVFDVYDIELGEYMKPAHRRVFVESLGLKHVPLVAYTAELVDTLGLNDINSILRFAEGASVLNPKQEREGVVFKHENGGMSFKAVSNVYLLKSDT